MLKKALEFKWLGYLMKKLDQHIDKVYDKILEDDFILPLVAREDDDNKVAAHMIEIKNKEINDFLEVQNQEVNKDKIKASFLDETIQTIENFKSEYSSQKYAESATKHLYGLTNFLKHKQTKRSKEIKDKLDKKKEKLEKQNNFVIMLNQLNQIEKKVSPEVSKASHPKTLRERS